MEQHTKSDSLWYHDNIKILLNLAAYDLTSFPLLVQLLLVTNLGLLGLGLQSALHTGSA